MTAWMAYVAISLSVSWSGEVEVHASPEVLTWSCPARTEVRAAPMHLTWSPKEGFGAASEVETTAGGLPPLYCGR